MERSDFKFGSELARPGEPCIASFRTEGKLTFLSSYAAAQARPRNSSELLGSRGSMRTTEDWTFGCRRKFALGDVYDVVDLGTVLDTHRETL